MILQSVSIPSDVAYLMRKLHDAGYQAYAVGGCIRDTLMNKQPDDWDICTSALPQQTLDVLQLPNIIENGLKHGTVTVRWHGANYEITTFRTEGAYIDNRRPSYVTFVSDVKEDLRRRDFTINALAYNEEEGLLDFFDGIDDIRHGIIRCVGNPDERFQEDGLRIMRALRFAARFGFQIEKETAAAIHRNAALLNNISAERIQTELNKMLLGDGVEAVLSEFADIIAIVIPEIQPMFGFDSGNPCDTCYDVWQHTVKVIADTPKEKTLRLAALLHDIGKPNTFTADSENADLFYGHQEEGERLSEIILRRLKYDNHTIAQVKALVRLHDYHPELTEKAVRRFLNQTGEELLPLLIALQKADCYAKGVPAAQEMTAYFDRLQRLCEKEMCTSTAYTLKMLAVNGNDLMALGIRGREVGNILQQLLEGVMDGNWPNEKAILLRQAEILHSTKAEKPF